MLDGQSLGIVVTSPASYTLFGPGSLNVGGFQGIGPASAGTHAVNIAGGHQYDSE